MPALHDAGHFNNLPLRLVVLAVAVPMEGVLHPIISQGFSLMSISVPSRPSFPTLPTPSPIIQKADQCPAALQLDAGDVVAEGVLELPLGPHAAVEDLSPSLRVLMTRWPLPSREMDLRDHHPSLHIASGMTSHLLVSSFVPSNSSCQTSFQVLPSGGVGKASLTLGRSILSRDSSYNDCKQAGDLHFSILGMW